MTLEGWIFMVGLRVFDVGALIVWLVWFFRLREDDDDEDGGHDDGGGNLPREDAPGGSGGGLELPKPDADPWPAGGATTAATARPRRRPPGGSRDPPSGRRASPASRAARPRQPLEVRDEPFALRHQPPGATAPEAIPRWTASTSATSSRPSGARTRAPPRPCAGTSGAKK